MPSSLGPPYKKAVVDTGPLFTALTLVYIRQSPANRHLVLYRHKIPPYITDPTSERNFLEFFHSLKEVLTTSHVIGQIKSRRRLPPEVYEDFLLCSMKFLSEKKLDERLITLRALYEQEDSRRMVCGLGPTDAGLLVLARQEDCVLLTDDSGLFPWRGPDGKPEIELVENVL
jgi:hypothetical protein